MMTCEFGKLRIGRKQGSSDQRTMGISRGKMRYDWKYLKMFRNKVRSVVRTLAFAVQI